MGSFKCDGGMSGQSTLILMGKRKGGRCAVAASGRQVGLVVVGGGFWMGQLE